MSTMRRWLAILGVAAATLFLGLTATPASAAPGLTATFAKVSDWGSGFEGKVTVTNGPAAAINGWTIEFDLPGRLLDHQFLGRATHAAAASTTRSATRPGRRRWPPARAPRFGFNGSPGNFGGILNCRFNGDPCDGGGGNPGAPSTPGTPSVTGTTNSSISLSWGGSSGTVTGYRVYEGSTVRATVTGTSPRSADSARAPRTPTRSPRTTASASPARSGSVTATTTGCPQRPAAAARRTCTWAGVTRPRRATVMSATGVKWFTMAFVLSGGGCSPAWDSTRPLTGGVDQQAINAIRAAGGDIVPSFGGWSGNKLGPELLDARRRWPAPTSR